jgi:hypothetical protein
MWNDTEKKNHQINSNEFKKTETPSCYYYKKKKRNRKQNKKSMLPTTSPPPPQTPPLLLLSPSSSLKLKSITPTKKKKITPLPWAPRKVLKKKLQFRREYSGSCGDDNDNNNNNNNNEPMSDLEL